jgi:ABC-type Na+ transport system ATPase subunit NatA
MKDLKAREALNTVAKGTLLLKNEMQLQQDMIDKLFQMIQLDHERIQELEMQVKEKVDEST